jgi:hypothetical protein
MLRAADVEAGRQTPRLALQPQLRSGAGHHFADPSQAAIARVDAVVDDLVGTEPGIAAEARPGVDSRRWRR